ncbi:MAG TPA: cell division FtsA domain-containing protein [Candidatus Paceibacterota bacterium]|uniref:Cell division protein FtsA n=1 Tax=Candidatus Wolfebacteria bacterium RIFCSPLOWO2_01_FULL_47_17b TaxID=1802558 RepID=A0A1F8DY89_9BACT|nr:MAG: hypothetical protein A2935_04210 [Candidatus Wolfebacteria bacterium RIFCSPLOWO2_01_FULL_47_17b]
MPELTLASIDVGSSNIRLLLADVTEQGLLRPRALVVEPSAGLRYGHIVSEEAVSRSIATAIREAEKISGTRIKRVVVGAGGVALGTTLVSATVAISRADSEVTDVDLERIQTESESRVLEAGNTKIIHTIPLEYKIDGKKIIGRPGGVRGGKLEAKTFFITQSSTHFKKLLKAVEGARVEVEDVFAEPMAESVVAASNLQKNAGCIIANIGAETVTISVFEDGIPKQVEVFKIGSVDLTHDIALGLRIPIEEAEEIKVGAKSVGQQKTNQKKIKEIVEARLSDIFEVIDNHLKKIGRSGLLPAGIILTGGGALVADIDELARKHLRLPAIVAKNTSVYLTKARSLSGLSKEEHRQALTERELLEAITGPEWSVAYGLLVLGSEMMEEDESMGSRLARTTRGHLSRWIQQFLP